VEKLRSCWSTVAVIEAAFLSLSGKTPKFGSLKANLAKLETLLYESAVLSSGVRGEEERASEAAP
jgi:hypothetical protein